MQCRRTLAKHSSASQRKGIAKESKVADNNLIQDKQRLFEALCSEAILYKGFQAVKRNKGAPGIDGQTVCSFENELDKELSQLIEELSNWTYKPKPVKRLEIPKPGKNKEMRNLGIPMVNS